MINIDVTHDQQQGWTLLMTGHAGTAPAGQDLVCCAASMLVYALAARLRELQTEGRARGVMIRLESGDAGAIASYTDGCRCALDEAYRTVLAGLRLLEKKHPEAVQLHCDFCEK